MMKRGRCIQNFTEVLFCLLLCSECTRNVLGQTSVPGRKSSDSTQLRVRQECDFEAKRVLGENAEVLRCSALNDTNVQEVVAVLKRAKVPADRYGGLAVWKLVILRHERSGWQKALMASDKNVTNGVGSVGIENIDDSSPFWGFRVNLLDERDDGKKAFELAIGFLNKDGSTEGLSFGISFNKAVGRYQEFDMNKDPDGFQKEIKQPLHFRGNGTKPTPIGSLNPNQARTPTSLF